MINKKGVDLAMKKIILGLIFIISSLSFYGKVEEYFQNKQNQVKIR